MERLLNIFFTFLFIPGFAFSQKVKFEASVDRTQLAAGEEFSITFSSNTDLPSFQTPSFENFRIASGPNYQNSVEIVNGKVSVQTLLSYTLTPKMEGTFKIGPASITVKGKTYYTQPITILVTGSSILSISKASKAQIISTGKTKDVFIVTSLNRDTVYEGEPILIRHKVYSKYEISTYDNLDYPSYDGFWTKILNESRGQNETEVMGDKAYYTYVLREIIAYPQKTGTLEIKPINGTIFVYPSESTRDPYGNIVASEKKYNLKGTGAKLVVLALPAKGAPANFSKNIGTFSIECTADKQELKANEAVTISITISGNGNFDLLQAPELKMPADVDVFPVKSKDNFNLTPEGVMGNKMFEYVLIPRKEGNYSITPELFTFFDTKKKNYVTLSSTEMKIKVNPGDNDDSGSFFSGEGTKKSTWASPAIYFVIGIPLLALIVFLFMRKKTVQSTTQQQMPDVAETTVKKAPVPSPAKTSGDFLQGAAELLHKGDNNKFYDVLLKGFYSYLSVKLDIPKAALTKEKITEVLHKKQFSTTRTEEFIELLSTCEMAKYAHMPNKETAHKTIEQAKEVFNALQEI